MLPSRGHLVLLHYDEDRVSVNHFSSSKILEPPRFYHNRSDILGMKWERNEREWGKGKIFYFGSVNSEKQEKPTFLSESKVFWRDRKCPLLAALDKARLYFQCIKAKKKRRKGKGKERTGRERKNETRQEKKK